MAVFAMAYHEMLLLTTVRCLLQLTSPVYSDFCSTVPVLPSDC